MYHVTSECSLNLNRCYFFLGLAIEMGDGGETDDLRCCLSCCNSRLCCCCSGKGHRVGVLALLILSVVKLHVPNSRRWRWRWRWRCSYSKCYFLTAGGLIYVAVPSKPSLLRLMRPLRIRKFLISSNQSYTISRLNCVNQSNVKLLIVRTLNHSYQHTDSSFFKVKIRAIVIVIQPPC